MADAVDVQRQLAAALLEAAQAHMGDANAGLRRDGERGQEDHVAKIRLTARDAAAGAASRGPQAATEGARPW